MKSIRHIFMNTALLLVFTLSGLSYAQEKDTDPTTVYYFIRHAEKDRSNPQNRDPELTSKGKERAEKWAQVFEYVNFDAVYATNYMRTQQTASPTALKHQLNVMPYNPRSFDVNTFKKKTLGKTVLIVGHSNTTPMLVNALLNRKKYTDIEDDNNANLYIITITKNHISDIVLKID